MARKRSLSLIRRRAAPVMRCLPGTAAITAASAGMRSGTSRTSTQARFSGRNSLCAARSPCAEAGSRPSTVTALPSALAASQKAAPDQSPSTRTLPGER